jgi:hypothetical protein
MKKHKFLLLIDGPTEGCRKVVPFNTYQAALKAGRALIANNACIENKILIIHGDILPISTDRDDAEKASL